MQLSKFILLFISSTFLWNISKAQMATGRDLSKLLWQVQGALHVSVRQYDGTRLIHEQA